MPYSSDFRKLCQNRIIKENLIFKTVCSHLHLVHQKVSTNFDISGVMHNIKVPIQFIYVVVIRASYFCYILKNCFMVSKMIDQLVHSFDRIPTFLLS